MYTMIENYLIKNPLKIIHIDTKSSQVERVYCVLGDIPNKIFAAIKKIDKSNGTAEQVKILTDFYSKSYKSKLGLRPDFLNVWMQSGRNDTNAERTRADASTRTRTGGKKASDDLQDIENLLAGVVDKSNSNNYSGKNIEYVLDYSIYPEDKFTEVKEKIQLITGIPTYRQHIYMYHNGLPLHTHKIYLDGSIANLDINGFSKASTTFGMPVNKEFYDKRDSIRIEAQDVFSIVGGYPVEVIFVVDLNDYIKANHLHLKEIINDSYQFEMLYYGFIIIFWPQLTKECFYELIANEMDFHYKYPELSKSSVDLERIYTAEKELIDENYRLLPRVNEYPKIAITQMVAKMSPREATIINIRNLFDTFRVTRFIPEIHAYVEHNNAHYLLRKHHLKNGNDIQFPTGALMKSGLIMAVSIRKEDQKTFHAKKSFSTVENELTHFIFLNIAADGNYYVKALWNEEDEIDFERNLKLIKKYIDPIINSINELGKYIFVLGSKLSIMNSSVYYSSLNMSIFWKRVMLENSFKLLKDLFEPYNKARILSLRASQGDKYEYIFRKGIYLFDSSLIERIVMAGSNILLDNHYAYLSNSAIKQKWDQNYDGRLMRMVHRTTDIKFEIINAMSEEFEYFYDYITVFTHKAMQDQNFVKSLTVSKNYTDILKLKKLREQDPELYNLKKHGSKKVYSMICQNQRQPVIYTADEIKAMNQTEVKKLTQYWNFTLNQPAYYGCPSKEYPYLSFTVNAHPKNYCLPCCSKKPQDDSNHSSMYNICLKTHLFTDKPKTTSRHIVGYGKDVDIARLSKLPEGSLKTILGTSGPYFLYGVPQNVPGVEHIGVIYAIAEALETNVAEIITNIVDGIKKSPIVFNTLFDGHLIDYFDTHEDLSTALIDLFVLNAPITITKKNFNSYAGLILELFHAFNNHRVFIFVDEQGTGESISLHLDEQIRDELKYAYDTGYIDDTQKFIIIVKRRNNYYPVFHIIPENYFKSYAIERKVYDTQSTVAKTLIDMVLFSAQSVGTTDNPIDLAFMTEFTKATAYRIVKKFINRRNICYAIMCSRKGAHDDDATDTNLIYVPIAYSAYLVDGIPIEHNALSRSAQILNRSDLEMLINDINNYIKTKHNISTMNASTSNANNVSISAAIYKYKLLSPTHSILLQDQYIGIEVNGLNFYHSVEDTPCTLTANKRILKYDPDDINKTILGKLPSADDPRITRRGYAFYNIYLYQLFIIEFVNYTKKETNKEIRNKLTNMLMNVNSNGLPATVENINKLLADFPSDRSYFLNVAVEIGKKKLKLKQIIDDYLEGRFDFDAVTLNNLTKMNHSQIVEYVKKIVNEFTVYDKDFGKNPFEFPNIYIPCETDSDVTYCDSTDHKLIIDRPPEELIKILAYDILDSLKNKYILNSIWHDTVHDFFQFITHINETVDIYVL